MIYRHDIAAGMVKAPTVLSTGEPLLEAGREAWTDALAPFTEQGFRAVEIHDGWLPFPTFSPGQIDDRRAALDPHGLASPSFAIARHSVIEPGRGEQNLTYTLDGLEIAHAMGATTLCIGLHPVLTEAQQSARFFWDEPGRRDARDEQTFNTAVARLSQIAERAAELDILVSLEIYEDTLLGSPESALALLEAIDMPHVGLNPDIGNLIRLDRPVEPWRDLLEAMLPHSNYWHVKNYTRVDTTTGANTAPTTLEDGVIDYREALDIAERADFDGIIVCEQYSDDWLEVLGANRVFLESLLTTERPLEKEKAL